MADQQDMIDAITAAITAAATAAQNAAAPAPGFGAQMQAAITAAIAAAAAPPPPAPVAGAWSLYPATVTNTYIDYATRQGAALFTAATLPLHKDSVSYSLSTPNNNLLLEDLTSRAGLSGWDDILTVPTAAGDKSLLTSHGAITRAEVTAHAKTILATEDRNKQNDAQLHEALRQTVDSTTKDTMARYHSDWRTQPTGAAAADPNQNSGILYLYTLLERSEVNTRATCSHVKAQLAVLNIAMTKQAKNDIKKFNSIVDAHILTLTKHSNPLSDEDMLNYLFKGYLACSDQAFKAFITKEQDDWTFKNVPLEPEALMKTALQKYETCILTKSWNRPTREAEEIIALKAQITSIKKTSNNPTSDDKTQANRQSGDKQRTPIADKVWTGDSKWRGVAPKDGAPTTKVHKGKTFHWCKFHKCWIGHKLADCNGAKAAAAKAARSKASKDDITASLAHIGIEDIEDEE